MFNSKSKSADLSESTVGSTTIIGAGTVINGDIESNGDIRIDGLIIGKIIAKTKILIGPDGIVEGDIIGQQADIFGKVSGDIRISDLLLLRGMCNINGDVYAGKLDIEPSAIFNGHCHMGANVIELNAETNIAASQ